MKEIFLFLYILTTGYYGVRQKKSSYLPVNYFFLEKKDNTVFWAITACLLWSTAYAGIKIGLQYDKPLHFAGWRFILSGLMILPFTVKPASYLAMLMEYRKVIMLVTLFQILGNYILFYFGLDLVPGALGAVIVGSQPLVTAVIASMVNKGEILTMRKVTTIISGIMGVILISAGRQALKLGDFSEIIGVLMILGANISAATGNVMVSLKSKGIHPFVLSSSSLLIGGVIISLMSIIFEGHTEMIFPAEYWISLLWLSFMAASAFSIWFMLLQRPGVKVSELNLWKFIVPGAGAVLSWILVPGEKPEILTIAGIIVITSSLILFYRNGKRIH